MKKYSLMVVVALTLSISLFALPNEVEPSTSVRKMFVTLGPIVEVQAFGIPLAAAELKFGIPIADRWHVVIPARVYSYEIDWSAFSGRKGQYLDVSSGVGARYHLPLAHFWSTDFQLFVEPSLRAGYRSFVAPAVWVGAYLQSGLTFVTSFGLMFGCGFGLSTGVWAWELAISPVFVTGEMSGILGYIW